MFTETYWEVGAQVSFVPKILYIVRSHTPNIRLVTIINTEKNTKNQPVVSGYAPCRMSVKLVNIFVWLLQDSWSAWRSWTFVWSCRSSRMSVKLVNIFLSLLQDSWSAWSSWIFFWSCKSSRMSVKLVNIFVWLLQDAWSAWSSRIFFWSCRSSRMSVKLVNIFVWLLQDSWSAWRSWKFFKRSGQSPSASTFY